GSAYENTKDTSNARKAYETAIELNPQDFTANYSLGALIYNQAVEKIKEMNNLPSTDQKGYDKLKVESDVLLQKCLPYLEKARTLKGDDLETLNALKELYARLNQMDKLDEVKAAIDKVPAIPKEWTK
ncbi:MAG: tetratricopeptide repeat protein, partial [Bacteroidota bacterium]